MFAPAVAMFAYLGAAALPAAAQEAIHHLPEWGWKPRLSPDGTMVAFRERRVPGNIYVSRLGEETSQAVTALPEGGIQSHAWSPQGDHIAFNKWTESSENSAIWTVDLAGGAPTRLTFGEHQEAKNPSWSPDGRRIAFQARVGYNPQDIYIVGADGTDEANLTNTPEVEEQDPAWSPDGSRIAIRRFDHIGVLSRSGDSLTVLTAGEGIDYGPTWSPDGALLAFESTRGGRSDVYVVTSDGTHTWRVTAYAECCSMTPTWLPGEEALAIAILGQNVVARIPLSAGVPAVVRPRTWGALKRDAR